MDNRTKIESMAADLHLLAAPLRLLANLLKVALFVLAAPLLCALMVLHYVIGGWDPFYSYLHAVQNAAPIMVPFVVLGALLLLVLHMLLIIAKDLGDMMDVLLRVPLFGVTLFALVSAFWFTVVRGCYGMKDRKQANAMSGVVLGFIAAFVTGMYVFEFKDGMPPAALFSLTTLAASSPTLLYLLYRGLKPSRF